MAKSRFNSTEVLSILEQAKAGQPIKALCREHKISRTTLHVWRQKLAKASIENPAKESPTSARKASTESITPLIVQQAHTGEA